MRNHIDMNFSKNTFWFTLFHEIGHIMNGDYGISFDAESGEEEEIADKYAENMLIPYELYRKFIEENRFDVQSISIFAKKLTGTLELCSEDC